MHNIFSQEQLKNIFPFHVLINNHLEILQVGYLISKILSDSLLKQLFYDHFKLTNVRKQQSFEQLKKAQNKLYFLSSLDGFISLKGAFYETSNSNLLIYIGNILPNQISDSINAKIGLKDFPTYDSYPDFLFIQRANEKAIQELKLSNKKIKATKTFSEKVISSMIDIVIVIDSKGNISRFNKSFHKKLQYDKNELVGKPFNSILEPDNNSQNTDFFISVINDSISNIDLNFMTKKGQLIPFSCSFSKIIDDSGHLEALVCIAQDITFRNIIELEKTKSLKAEMETSNAKKRSQELKNINEELIKSESKIKKSLDEKDILLREIHHRVKNNLQVITSLLSLQSSYTQDSNILEMFQTSQQRITSMALIHEMLYHTDDFTKINYSNYLQKLFDSNIISFFVKNHKVKFDLEVDCMFLNLDTAIPLGLLINEILTNSFKHGLNRKSEGLIYIKIEAQEYPGYVIYIGDYGVGLPKNYNYKNSNSLGMKLIYKLAIQLQGKVKMDYSKKGTHYVIYFQEILNVF